EARGNDGLWDGSLYVFDQRMSLEFAPGAAVLGTCVVCGASTKRMMNCIEPSCREQLVVCHDCSGTHITCAKHVEFAL
ncbi:MAG: hypothetical protein JJE28_02850, partial [Actinomycetales bacterium]|nr:hypothetical protein [Actinomycetales bacterium]